MVDWRHQPCPSYFLTCATLHLIATPRVGCATTQRMGGVVLLLQESVTGRPCTVGIERGVHKRRNSNKEAVHKQRDARHLHAAKQKPCWFLQFLKDVVEPTQFIELVFQTTVNRQPAGDGVNCLHREASIRSALKGTGMRPQKGIFEATQPLKPPFQATAHC